MRTRLLHLPLNAALLTIASGLFGPALAAHAGALSGIYEVIASASTVNLTAEGTIDWAHWGRNTPTDFNHRAGVAQQISNFTVVGEGPILQFGDNFTGYSWTNGTPVAKATRSTSGIYVNGENNGFQISVPADLTVKTLKVYAGAYAAQMHFEASLSDNSAPSYVDESFQNASDGPNRAYVLNFAANSAGQQLVVKYWVINGSGGNVTLQAAALREGAPLVELVKPVNGSIFQAAADGLQFKASTISPNSIPTNQVKLFLNDKDVSSNLELSGSATSRAANFSQLAPNQFYQGVVIVADQTGQATTNRFVFDTFSDEGTVVVEDEDYNYSSDGFTGGMFKDNPAPNAFQDLAGVPEVDYYTTGQGTSAYRAGDAIGAALSTDQLRTPWVTAGLPDYHVTDLQSGDWLNYTRTFPQGNYYAYLRYAALDDQVVELGQVTSDARQPNQTVKTLGTINAVRTGNESSYRYAPMTDALGKLIVLTLSGKQTLRLTCINVEPGFNGLRANFLLFAPAAGSASRGTTVDTANPGPDAEDVAPDAPVTLTILNGDTAVTASSIVLRLDDNDVSGTAKILTTATGASVNYQPPRMFPLGSIHSITLIFGDNSSVFQTNRWTFTVANLPILPGAWSTPTGSGKTNGFLIKMAKAPNDSDPNLFTNSAARAELQLSGRLIEPSSGEAVANEAAGPNGDGTYFEPNTLNYQQDGNQAGYFPGDITFPGVGAGDPNFMAMQATFYLELAAGIHRFGVRCDDGFLLSAGLTLTNATLELGRFEGTRGSDLPDGSTEFEFLVENSGVYAFRLLWYEGIGGADLELFSVDRSTLGSASVTRTLINEPGNPQAIKAFTGRLGTPSPTPKAPTIQVLRSGSNLSFTFPTETGAVYSLESKQGLSDPAWQGAAAPITGDGTAKTLEAPITGVSRFFRLNVQ